MIESKKIKNPFPGLRPFETDEYRLFFGREGQSDALIARLQHSHFLAVVGTSGSGKSSLVRAGLLPALRGGLMAGAGSGWRIAIMRPGSDPIGNLALALANEEVLLEAGGGLPPAEAEAVIEATLRRGSLGLVEATRQARLAEHEKLLVVVDQFEELFRFRAARAPSSTGDDASAFVKLLLEASQQREQSIYVVATMRSDFLGDCAQFQGLPEVINDGQYLIPRMTRDERRFAITGPIGVTRGKIMEPLVNRLMNDVGDNPDQLPILQHALMRTWYYWDAHRRNGEPISLEHYEAIGTMSEALSRHADEAFEQLPDGLRPVAESLFKTLTERGADNREIRRPTRLKDICEIAGARAQEVVAVIDVFRDEGCSFLMPPAGVALQPETVIDISHESLIRNWRRLQGWVNEEAQSARIYRRLAEAAALNSEGSEGLLQDPALQIALTWYEDSHPNPAWAERYQPGFKEALAYLETSRAARDAALDQQERQRQLEIERDRRELETAHAFAQKQARSAHRMRRLTAALCLILLFAVGTAAYALHLRSEAKRSEKDARVAEVAAQKSEREAKNLAARLQTLANDLTTKKKEAEDALKAESKALDAQELETKRANKQTRIAAESLRKAEIARKEAEENAKEIVAAGKRDELLRLSIEASRREDHPGALNYLNELQAKLRPLQPDATHGQGSLQLTPERSKQFVMELGWTLSDIGAIYQEDHNYPDAIANYEEALAKLKKVLPENSDNPILFGTYNGLAHSYHGVARPGTPRGTKMVYRADREQYLRKAEDYYKKALAFQKEHRTGKPAEIAGGHLNLARLYSDLHNDEETVRNYRLAIELLREDRPNEADAALRELALFHRDAGRYADAEKVYNELITSQEDITIFEFAEKGQAIANIYSELADVYRADGKEKEADDVFHVADLIQKVSLKLKRNDDNVDLKLDDDLDDMGDAYIKLGKFSDAEVLYKQALDFRKERPEKEQFLWKSYDKLTKLYREYIKDDKKAEEFNNLLIEHLKNSKDGSNRYVDSLVQLAALYAKDPNRYAEAESLYTRALDIAMAQDDWQYPNLILYQLGQLYLKQKRTPEREQVIRRRLETLTKYFKRLTDLPPRRPKAPNTLVSEYLNAVEAAAYFFAKVSKNDAEAEAAYQPAFAEYDAITRTVFNSKVLEAYALTLDHYKDLLTKLAKLAEAVKVSEKVEGLREKLHQLNQIYSQNAPTQQGPVTAPTAP